MKFLLSTLSVFCFFAYVHAEPEFFGGAAPTRRAVEVIGPAGGICAGLEAAPKTAADRSRVYISRCSGAFNTTRNGKDAYDKTWGYLSMEMVGIALVRGADGAYVTSPSTCTDGDASKCTSKNNMLIMKVGTAANNGYFKKDANKEAGKGNNYAFSSTGAYFANAPAGAGFYAGTATYLATKGTIKTNENTFDIAGTDKKACISQITDQGKATAKCGANREFKAGHYKFSLFGYTTDSATNDITKAIKNSTGGAFTHTGFRQMLKLGGIPKGATVTGGVQLMAGGRKKFTNAEMKGQDVKGFQMCVNGQCLEYAFPTKYNFGKLTAGEAKLDATSATSDLKVKVSVPDSKVCTNCAYIDYLMPIGKMTTKDWWFVYDPEVAPAAETSTTSAAPHTSQLSFVAAVVAVMVAFMKF